MLYNLCCVIYFILPSLNSLYIFLLNILLFTITIQANENRCCQLLEVSIAKAQHLVWRMTHGDPTKTTFLAEEQLPNTPKAKKLIGTMEKLAIKGIQSHLDRVVLDCKYAYGSKADSAELQKQEIKNRFNSTFSKQIAALDLDTKLLHRIIT